MRENSDSAFQRKDAETRSAAKTLLRKLCIPLQLRVFALQTALPNSHYAINSRIG